MGQEEVIRDAFTRARDYKADWDEYRARVAKGEKGLVAPRRDLELEPQRLELALVLQLRAAVQRRQADVERLAEELQDGHRRR